jgi:hypothetical protein
LPPSTSANCPAHPERRIVKASASIAAGIPVDLSDTATGLDAHNVERLIASDRPRIRRRPKRGPRAIASCGMIQPWQRQRVTRGVGLRGQFWLQGTPKEEAIPGASTWRQVRTRGLEVDGTDVSCMAGHANVRTTLDIYVGSTAGILDRARQATQ